MKLETKDLAATLKRKAVEQRLTHPQNLITEVLGDATPELNRAIPQKESLTKVVQRSRAAASGSSLADCIYYYCVYYLILVKTL